MATEANAKESPFQHVPSSVLSSRVFLNLTARELLTCAQVCKEWLDLSKSDECWHQQCKTLWKGKAEMPYAYPGCKKPPLFSRCRLSTECIKSLSIREMSQILHKRNVHYSHFLEKSEFVQAMIRSQPAHVLDWSMKYDHKFLAYYVYSWLDGQRNHITQQELSSMEWECTLGGDTRHVYVSEFKEDGAYVITSWLNAPSLWWKFVNVDTPSGPLRTIRVGDYPNLVVTRMPDWSWKLKNEYAVLRSMHYGLDR